MATTTQTALERRAGGKLAAMRDFIVVWLGQLVSTIGSGMTGFALGVYVYQRTNSATDFALIFLAGMLPRALVSPIAGVIADRFDRRKVMIVSDVGASIGSLIALALALTGQMQVWQIYLTTFITASFGALRVPAYTASAATLVPKEQYGRGGGMLQLNEALGQVIAPVVAGARITTFALPSVLMIDVATFVVALITLFIVRFPNVTTGTQTRKGSFMSQVRYGWDYLVARPGLKRRHRERSPAMAAGLTDHLWNVGDILNLPLIFEGGAC